MAKSKAQEAHDTTALLSFQFIMPSEDDPIVYESEDLHRKALKVTIKTTKGLEQVNGWLVRTKELLTDGVEKKKALLLPIKEQLIDPVNNYFDKVLPPLVKAEKSFKAAIADYMLRKEEEAVELAKVFKDEGEEVVMVVAAPTKIETATALTTSTNHWDIKVEDYNKVPIEHLRAAVQTKRGMEALDQIIRGLVAAGIRRIPGVSITAGKSISVTLK